MDFLAALDTQIFLAIHGVAHCAFADSFVTVFTGRFTWIPLYVALLWFLLRTLGTKKALVCLLSIAVAVTLADQVCATIIRPYVERMRPANLLNPLSQFVQVVDGYRGGRYGFPSCHAANTFALATFMMLLTRNVRISIFVYAWALINCYTRLYLGVHYPGDLLVGAAIGGLIAVLIYFVMAHFMPMQKVSDDTNFRPAYIVGAAMVVGITIYAMIW